MPISQPWPWLESMARRKALRRLAIFLAGSPFLRSQIDPFEDHSRVPGLNEIFSVFDFERAAHAKVPRSSYDYTAMGVDGEFTLRRNRQAFDWVTLIPRTMTDVSSIDLSTEVFGQKMSCPILVAPSSGHARMHPEGELATHQGATAANVTMSVSTASSFPIEKIADAAKGPLWFQLYASDSPEETRERVEKAVAAGCRAVCLTVDVQYYSHRERELHDRNLNPPAVTMAGRPAAPGSRRATAAAARPPNAYHIRGQAAFLDWKMVDEIHSYTKVPLLLKGVQNAADARLAAQRGLDGVIVSNHGGRYLDYAPSTLEVLPEIVDAVGGRAPVLIDSGFRRGADILKALALGAKGVQVGRAPVWGLGAFGAPGVQRVLEILRAELAQAMADTGRPTIASIDRTLVAVDFV